MSSLSTHTNLSSHTGRHNKQRYFIVPWGTPFRQIYILKNYNKSNCTLDDRYFSPTIRHHIRGHYSVLQSSFLSGPLTKFNRMDFFSFKYLNANYLPFSEVCTFFTSPCVGFYPTSSVRPGLPMVSTLPAVSSRLIPQAGPAYGLHPTSSVS